MGNRRYLRPDCCNACRLSAGKYRRVSAGSLFPNEKNKVFVVFDTKSPSILLTAIVEDVKNRGGSHYVTAKIKPVLDKYFDENE